MTLGSGRHLIIENKFGHMKKQNRIFASLLLAVYAIVFFHAIIPHHHHDADTDNCSGVTEAFAYNNQDQCCSYDKGKGLNSHTQEDSHPDYHCHFEVQPIPLKKIEISIFYVAIVKYADCLVLLQQVVDYCSYFLPFSTTICLEGISLRGPPFFA